MPIFKIAQGPWKLLMSGSLKEQVLEVYTNNEKVIYVQIIEQKDGKMVKATCEFYKPYVVKGDIDGFVQILPREILVVTKHLKDGTNKFLLIGSSPVTVLWDENVVLEQTDILLKKLEVGTSLMKEVAKAYDVELKPMYQAEEEISNAFFSIPLSVPLVSTNAHFHQTEEKGKAATAIPSRLPGEFVLGKTDAGLLVKEPIAFFKKTLITGAREQNRKHLMQIIIEGALFSNIPVVVIDWEGEFSIMRNPNPESKYLQEMELEGEPLGFPLKEFLPTSNVKLQLSMLNPEAFAEILGLKETGLGENLVLFLREHHATSIDEAIHLLKQMPPTEQFTPFQIAGVIRLFALLNQTYPQLFDGVNSTEEISKNWFQAIGRIGIIKVKEAPPKFRNLLVYTIIKGIYEWYQHQGVSNRMKSLIAIPKIEQLFDYKNEPTLAKEFEKLFLQSNTQDVGFVFSTQHQIELSRQLLEIIESRLSVVGGKEIAVTLAGRKNYRLTMRDTFAKSVSKGFYNT
jgi:hypothetical protein